MPKRMMHQSWSGPGPRRRRVSHPSIHLPRSVYLPSRNTPRPGSSRFSLGAKNSSLARSARPPTQPRGIDGELRVRIEHHQVGIGPRGDAALAAQTGEPGRPLGEPASEVARVVAARARAGPRDGERQLERGHAAPRAEEVAGLEALQLRGGWGVVARHEVDRPLGQTGPQALAVLPLTNRRGA